MTDKTNEMQIQKKALNFDESRMYCGGFSRPRFYELKIPSFKVGRKRFFLRAELDQWLAAQAAAGRNE